VEEKKGRRLYATGGVTETIANAMRAQEYKARLGTLKEGDRSWRWAKRGGRAIWWKDVVGNAWGG